MTKLVKSGDVRSGRKAEARHSQHRHYWVKKVNLESFDAHLPM